MVLWLVRVRVQMERTCMYVHARRVPTAASVGWEARSSMSHLPCPFPVPALCTVCKLLCKLLRKLRYVQCADVPHFPNIIIIDRDLTLTTILHPLSLGRSSKPSKRLLVVPYVYCVYLYVYRRVHITAWSINNAHCY